MGTPVLVLIHARPDHTAKLLEAIDEWDISCLYIAADGPRPSHEQDKINCEQARSIALARAGDRPVKTLFRDDNLGLARAISSAIDWFFDHEEHGIILEDDCIPDASFLPFCAELLERYRHEPNVMMISGDSYLPEKLTLTNSYRFTRHVHIWGWATWKRAWAHMDRDMSNWPSLRRSRWLLDVCNGHRDALRYWRWIFDRAARTLWRSWAYPWTFSMWLNKGVAILPGRNLVTNVGFGDLATNTLDRPDWYDNISSGPVTFPLVHPPSTALDPEIDHWIDRHIFRTTNRWYRTMRLVARVTGPIGLEGRLRRLYRRLHSQVKSHG